MKPFYDDVIISVARTSNSNTIISTGGYINIRQFCYIHILKNRIQTWLDLCVANPADADSRILLHEASPSTFSSWTTRARPPRWLADGTFLWLSERTGQRHVYRYRADGERVGAVTSGDWSVRVPAGTAARGW